MRQLTYADRESLLQTFDSLSDTWDGSDDCLLADACKFARELVPSFGFELAITRDITALSRYLLLHSSDDDIAQIARGGLLYVAKASQVGLPRLGDFGLIDVAFVTGYAVHEIRTRLGEPAIYNPPRLNRCEQERAETLFLKLLESPALHDDELVKHARSAGDNLAGLADCGFLRRLRKNIDFLISVLEDPQRSTEQCAYARGSLAYLVCEEDAIDDRLGIVGYLDDNFVAQLAVDLIEPTRDPWLELLDASVGVWPFLNGLFIDDGGGGRPISEYGIINSAIACPELRRSKARSATLLVVPDIGPTPFMLGFTAALGLIHKLGQREITEESFHPGQRVLVDGCAIAEFGGVESCNGRRMFKLRQHYTESGHRLERTRYWPISDLRRLVPAAASRSVRGEIIYDLGHSDKPLPALDYLFNSSKMADLVAVDKRVIVVMPLAAANAIEKQLRFCGHPLKDVIPMGHLTTGQEIKPWSNRFGRQSPLLVFAPDLDAACAFAEQNPGENELVIVDASGRNAKKTASLHRLGQFNIRTLIIAEERIANELDLANNDRVDVWEWEEEDFDALLWPQQNHAATSGLITRYERRLQTLSSAAIDIRTIPLISARRAFESVKELRRLARARGEEQLAELDDMLALAFGLVSRLMRSATPLTPDIASFKEIESGICEMSGVGRSSLFLSQAEKSALATACDSLRALFVELQQENPKGALLREILLANPGLTIVCPDSRVWADLSITYADTHTRVVYAPKDDDDTLAGAVIPGWFRKDRMADLLMPPVTSPLFLVFYDIEQEWYSAFRREGRKARKLRLSHSARAKVFPAVPGWGAAKEDDPPMADEQQSGLHELEAIQQYVQTGYRQRVYKSARSDGSESEVPARLVLFEGAMHALLTDSYRANVVTHLLDATIDEDDEKADIKRVPTAKLMPGDALLFHRGSERDVIRDAADQILPPGVRDLSSLWRKALLYYVTENRIDSETLWKRLQSAGCPLKEQTIGIWLDSEELIAPQAYSRDIGIIAQVTGDASLLKRMNDVLTAVSEVRSAHLRASSQLAKKVIAQAVSLIREEGRNSPLIEIEANVIVVRILEIDDRRVPARLSLVNRLLEGDQ